MIQNVGKKLTDSQLNLPHQTTNSKNKDEDLKSKWHFVLSSYMLELFVNVVSIWSLRWHFTNFVVNTLCAWCSWDRIIGLYFAAGDPKMVEEKMRQKYEKLDVESRNQFVREVISQKGTEEVGRTMPVTCLRFFCCQSYVPVDLLLVHLLRVFITIIYITVIDFCLKTLLQTDLQCI